MFNKLVRTFLETMGVRIVRPEEATRFPLLTDSLFDRDVAKNEAAHRRRPDSYIPNNAESLGRHIAR